jgi:Uma2 family endonuclease
MASDLEANIALPPVRVGEPAWAIAALFPLQGQWSEEDYFFLETSRHIELVDGCIEVLPMPTWLHQVIVYWLADKLRDWNKSANVGEVLFAPLPLRLFPGVIREPDVLLVRRSTQTPRPRYPEAALLVIEVVSEGAEAHERDYVTKRENYEKAGVPEYWIVDPLQKAVTILRLEQGEYVQHSRLEGNQIANSATLPGFTVDCEQIWKLETEV